MSCVLSPLASVCFLGGWSHHAHTGLPLCPPGAMGWGRPGEQWAVLVATGCLAQRAPLPRVSFQRSWWNQPQTFKKETELSLALSWHGNISLWFKTKQQQQQLYISNETSANIC